MYFRHPTFFFQTNYHNDDRFIISGMAKGGGGVERGEGAGGY